MVERTALVVTALLFALAALGLSVAAYVKLDNETLDRITSLEAQSEMRAAQLAAASERSETTFGVPAVTLPHATGTPYTLSMTGMPATFMEWSEYNSITAAGTYSMGFQWNVQLPQPVSAVQVSITVLSAGTAVDRFTRVIFDRVASNADTVVGQVVVSEAQLPANITFAFSTQGLSNANIVLREPTYAWVTKLL